MINKILNIVNRIVRKTYWFNNILFPDCRKFWTLHEFDQEIVNLGSRSALCGFNYDALSLKAKNWALAPQSFVGDYEILRNYYSYLAQNAVVLLPICPFSCLGGGNDYLDDRYYTILNIASIPHASYRRKQQVLQMMNHAYSFYPAAEILKSFTRIFRKKQTCHDFSSDASSKMLQWGKEFSITDFEKSFSLVNKDRYKDSSMQLTEIIDFCIERSLIPVLVLPPITKELSGFFTKEMKEKYMYSFIRESNEHNILFLDYLDDEEFINKEYFQNSFLLNDLGSKVFTKRVICDLRTYGIVK